MTVLLNPGENWQSVFNASFPNLQPFERIELPFTFVGGRHLLRIVESPPTDLILAGWLQVMPILDGNFAGVKACVAESVRPILNEYYFINQPDNFRIVHWVRPGISALTFQAYRAQ